MTAATQTLTDLPARLASKIAADGGGCWLWTAGLNRNGYGRTTRTNSRQMVMAHRYVYEILAGQIPAGYQLDHLCRIRRCVNPEHLEPVTQRTNLMRGDTLPARAAAASACPAGHPYSGDNLYVNPKGHRYCRECHRLRVASARAKDPEKMRAQARAADARYRARKRAAREEWRP